MSLVSKNSFVAASMNKLFVVQMDLGVVEFCALELLLQPIHEAMAPAISFLVARHDGEKATVMRDLLVTARMLVAVARYRIVS